jgi:penicillin-binding protein 1A
MFKNSGLYNPYEPEGVTNRRNVVLSQMAKNHHKREKKNYKVYRLN